MIGLKYKAAITISRFFVAIMIIVVIMFGVKTLLENWKEGAVTLHPKKTLIVIIDSSQREKFFEQLTRFADAYAFKIHIGPTTPAGNTFNVNMSRSFVGSSKIKKLGFAIKIVNKYNLFCSPPLKVET